MNEEQMEAHVVDMLLEQRLKELGVRELSRSFALDDDGALVIKVAALRPINHINVTFEALPENPDPRSP
jgi:hypothetical protein